MTPFDLKRYIDPFIKKYIESESAKTKSLAEPALERLWESVEYSLFTGGKRFRPVLSFATAEALAKPPEQVVAFAAAVEFIHTYSLVHDDLPLMDNDDLRRGQPTTHCKYDDVTALLAGDGLLTEAFRVLSVHYREQPYVALEAIQLLSQAAGLNGMVGGQAIDIQVEKAESATASTLTNVHRLKTGALITVAVEGAAVVCEAAEEARKDLKAYGEHVGFAFQLADDLLDHDDNAPEAASFTALYGVERTRELLKKETQAALSALAPFGDKASMLEEVAQYNLNRLV